MSDRLAFQTQLASIMEDLANAAVAEICKLVDDDYAVVSLQMSQCQRENKALKRKVHLLELKMARGHAERRLRESGSNSSRPRMQILSGDRRRDSSTHAGRVFERQIDLTLWSDKDATGDTGSQPAHSDNIQSQLEDVELMEPGVELVKEEKVEANVSCIEEVEDILHIQDNGVVDRVPQTGVSGQRLELEESVQNQTQRRRSRSTGNNINRRVEKDKEPDVVLVKVEEADPLRAAQKWIDLGVHKDLMDLNADDFSEVLPFNAMPASADPLSDLQESVGALAEADYGHTSLWTNGESSYCHNSSLSRPSAHCAPLSFLPDTLNAVQSGIGPVMQNATGGASAADGSIVGLSEDSGTSQARGCAQGEQLSLPFLNHHPPKDKGRCRVSRKRCFICRFCGKGLSSQANLESHLRTHTGERPYGCSICGKKFSQFWNLKIHRHIHTGERPYKCSLCPDKFSDPSNLKKHQRRHHTQVAPLHRRGLSLSVEPTFSK